MFMNTFENNDTLTNMWSGGYSIGLKSASGGLSEIGSVGTGESVTSSTRMSPSLTASSSGGGSRRAGGGRVMISSCNITSHLLICMVNCRNYSYQKKYSHNAITLLKKKYI